MSHHRAGRYFSTEEEPGGERSRHEASEDLRPDLLLLHQRGAVPVVPETEPLAPPPRVPVHVHHNPASEEMLPLRDPEAVVQPPPRRRPPNQDSPNPWTSRLSQRASRLWAGAAFYSNQNSHSQKNNTGQSNYNNSQYHEVNSHRKTNTNTKPKKKKTCWQLFCCYVLPVLCLGLVVLAVTNCATYFTVKKVRFQQPQRNCLSCI